MSKEMMDALYMEHSEKIGVLSSNEREVVSQVIGTDLTLVYDKQECKTYLLVPLTKNHTFKCRGNRIEVDGKRFDSEVFFRKDACQWIEMNERTLSKVA